MISFLRRMVSGPTPEELAARELDNARRALLEAQTAEEYARSQVIYNKQRIARLRSWLADQVDQGGNENPSF